MGSCQSRPPGAGLPVTGLIWVAVCAARHAVMTSSSCISLLDVAGLCAGRSDGRQGNESLTRQPELTSRGHDEGDPADRRAQWPRPDLAAQAVMMAAHGRPHPVQAMLWAGERALHNVGRAARGDPGGSARGGRGLRVLRLSRTSGRGQRADPDLLRHAWRGSRAGSTTVGHLTNTLQHRGRRCRARHCLID